MAEKFDEFKDLVSDLASVVPKFPEAMSKVSEQRKPRITGTGWILGQNGEADTAVAEPERFVDARSGDAVLSGITAEDIEPMFEQGCGQVWTKTNLGFRGYTDPDTCRIISSRTGKPRRIEAEAVLTQDTLALVERGYDDEMNQLFGTPQGDATELHRID